MCIERLDDQFLHILQNTASVEHHPKKRVQRIAFRPRQSLLQHTTHPWRAQTRPEPLPVVLGHTRTHTHTSMNSLKTHRKV